MRCARSCRVPASFFMISVMTGDIATVSSTAASIPMLLVQTGYSREFEKEADREAALYSIRKGWGMGPYIKMLEKLHKGETQGPSLPFLSTHPTFAERVKHIKELGEKKNALGGHTGLESHSTVFAVILQ